MRMTGSQSSWSTSAFTVSHTASCFSAKLQPWHCEHTSSIFWRFTSKVCWLMVRMGTEVFGGAAGSPMTAPWATVPTVRLVDTSCVSGSPAPFSRMGMWQVTQVGAREGSPPARSFSVA